MKQHENIFKPISAIKNTTIEDKKPLNIICKKICLFANVRDEKHIREWAAHHLLIGFDKIIIFDHKSIIPLKKVFKGFDKRVKIINVSHLGKSIKGPLMNKASEIAKMLEMDWMIYLDADEFIILNKFKNVKDVLSIYNHADSLGVNWLFFGSNYLEKDPDGLILENYTRSDLFLNDHLKSFVRPVKIICQGNPHFYHIKDRTRYFGIHGGNIKNFYNNNNTIINNNSFHESYHSNVYHIEYYKAPIYIAHYVNQSEETFTKRKIDLPRDDNGENRQFKNIMEIHNQFNTIENNDPKNKYAENIKTFLKKYGHEF
jgi:hypothetical protein